MTACARKVVFAFMALAALAGCASPPSSGSDAGRDGGADTSSDGTMGPQQVTYWRDIAPIINAHCTSCHVAGGIAPFALDSYAEVEARAPQLAQVTRDRIMPPWMPSTEGCRTLQNVRRLTQEQIDLIGRWVEQGALEGNPSDYVAPPPEMQQLPATPDLAVQPEQAYMPAARNGGADDYHCFIMDPGLTETRDVVGMRIIPGNAAIVHHVLLFEVRSGGMGQLQANDDAEPGPGYTCFGGPQIDANWRPAPMGSSEPVDFDVQMIGGWAPGSVPGYFPATTGIRLHAGSRLVMQVHYNLAAAGASGMTDRSRAELFFAPRGVPSPAIWLPLANYSFTVPAGAGPTDPAATVTAQFSAMQAPVRLFGVFPHMHLRGHSIRMDVRHPDGREECLINIPRWNFHWQQSYFFLSPLRAMAGSTREMSDLLRLTCVYDNTPANQPVIDGVQQQPHDLHWGEGTDDEMCLSFIYVAL